MRLETAITIALMGCLLAMIGDVLGVIRYSVMVNGSESIKFSIYFGVVQPSIYLSFHGGFAWFFHVLLKRQKAGS